jgi:hypothetical protein
MKTYDKLLAGSRAKTKGKTVRGGASVYLTPGKRTVELSVTDVTSRSFYPIVATSVTVAGGTYQKNGTGGFISTATSSVSGDSFELRLATASGEYETASAVTLTCDGIDFVFTVTTIAGDSIAGRYTDTEHYTDLENYV